MNQLVALLRKTAISKRRHLRRATVEVALPPLLAAAFTLVPILGGESLVPAKTSVDRAVYLGDPFDTKYAARLCTDGAIFAVAPEGGLGEEFRAFLRTRFGAQPQGWPRFIALADGEEVEEYATAEDYASPGRPALCGAVIFESASSFALRLNGTIVGNRGAVCGGVDTRRTTTSRGIDAKATSQDWYLCSGFLALQRLASDFLASRHSAPPERTWQLDLDVVPFPTPSFKSRAALSATRELIGLAVVLFFAYVAGRTTADIVAEREQKLLEAMRLLGLQDGALFGAYALGMLPVLTFYGLEFSLVLAYGIFVRSSVILFSLFFALFGSAVASMALCASAFFDSAKTASVAVVVCIFAVSRFGVESAWACLLPPLALVQGLARIVELELIDVGLRWGSMWDDMGFPCSTGSVMLYLAADTVIYLVLWVYFERVVPHKFGAAARPWYRPWSSDARSGGTQRDDANRGSVLVTRKRVSENTRGIIQDTLPVACIVEVKGLRKEYFVEGRRASHRLVAVRSLDLGMAESEILALLGHNGAGKSTTISMLTGLLQPTKGKISVCGYDVSQQPAEARHCLGLCPQHDVLFDDLTASEHLGFAAELRGLGAGATVAASGLLNAVGLCGALAANVPAGALPAGRRRALGVALALVGSPRFLVLDEPTSGMDPFVRRTMWELLKQNRSGRAICLSTHYMDEAEMLGDQVCVLSRGTVQCYGSPDWLKVRLGSGYLMTLILASDSQQGGEQTAQAALTLLQQNAPEGLRKEISVTSFNASEVVIRVPFNASREFPTLLRALDSQKSKMGISTVTISATTLEELFVRLADGEVEGLPAPAGASAAVSTAVGAGGAPAEELRGASPSSPGSGLTERTASSLEAMMGELARTSGGSCKARQAAALLLKRWQFVQRSTRSLLCLCLLPLLFNVLGIASIATTFELNSPPLEVMGTGQDLNPRLDKGQRMVVPYSARNASWWSASPQKLIEELLYAGAEAEQWDLLDFLATDRAMHRATSPRGWGEDLQVEASFVGGQELALDGGMDLSKYADMREKGAPEFVIRKVMEKDGFSSAAVERFLSGPQDAQDDFAATGRVMLGLRDRVQGAVDTGKKEAKLELSFGRAMLRAEASARSDEFREELVSCAAGGPAQAVRAEEAMKSLDDETRKMLQAMQEGGAPAFARRAVLEKAGLAAEDVEILALAASTEAIPPEQRRQLQRCADWQAFATALLGSRGARAASRYGGFYVESIDGAARKARIAIFQNTSVPHSAPLFLGLLHHTALLHGGSAFEPPPKVTVTNWPLPLTAEQKRRAFSSQGFSFFTMSLIGASFLPASVASDIARELSGGVLRQQAIAGLPPSLFSTVNFAADVVLVVPPLLTQLAFIKIFQLAVYVDCLGLLAALLLLYALTATAQVYALLPELKSPTGALNAMLAQNVVTGFILATAVWVLSIPFLGTTANTIARIVTIVCRISPAFNLANAVLTIPNTALPGFSVVYGMGPWAWQVTGEPLFGLIMNLLLYAAIAIRRGTGPGATVEPTGPVDEERGREEGGSARRTEEVVAEEKAAREAFRPGGPGEKGLVLRDLAVTFRNRTRGSRAGSALLLRGRGEEGEDRGVGPLSLVAPPGSVLGLLGLSGSGKSSALAALVGALPMGARVRGLAAVNGIQTCGRRPKVGDIGYCPQESELSQCLTVLEHTRLFGRLRGLDAKLLEREVRWLLGALDLGAFEYSLSQNLSGGNQRKLQCACAFIGSPKLICLDEPSAGLDPVARRSLWRTVLSRLRTESIVVVATKSIDEAEALCSKLAILGRDGQLSTIGSAADLRTRYGGGQELRMALKRPTMSEVYDSVVESKDPEALVGFVETCVSGLGARVSSHPALRSFAARFLAQDGPRSSCEQFLAGLHAAPWVNGLDPTGHDASRELLPEDCDAMKAELASRSRGVLQILEGLFSGVRCVEAVSLTRVYRLSDGSSAPHGTRNIADVFQSIETRMDEMKIADYSIMQTSLEHIFNQLATQE